MSLSAGTRLGPYEILSPIGAGGMGEVYRARDSKLQRDVAIKVLPQVVANDPDTLARFEREALAVASLSHPNILSIFDFGKDGGVAYAVMELLEGDTLRGKLDRGPIPQKQALDYALQTARGLSAAHQKGVVHRDLKPENLFVTKDGHVKILDFGLAKKVGSTVPGEQTSAPTLSDYTEPGTVMGTVGYMSPEQVRGLAVDQRSDIFSFGAILYELLSGKRAFRKDTAADTMSAILKEEPPELTDAGPALDHIVRHCLEKDRDHRFQSARDIAFALGETSSFPAASGARPAASGRTRRFPLAVGAIVVLAAVGFFLVRQSHETTTAGAVKRIAVLPFENLGAPEDDYFTDGMADAVRGKLTMLPGVEVIARASSMPYKKSAKSPQQIAAELDAPFLLTGTVRWDKAGGGNRVEVRPELVEVRGQAAPASRWQQPFDASLTDVFRVQSDVAERVAQSLGVVIGASDAKQLRETPTANLAAYDAFLKGEEVWRRNLGWDIGFEQMIRAYEQAVALDPGFAEAWSRLSRAKTHRYAAAGADAELAEQARVAAERASALAPDSVEARLAMGEYLYWVRHEGEQALAELDKGQLVAPGNVDLLYSRSYVEGMIGRKEASEKHAREASRLDPRSIQAKEALAGDLANRGRYREARELLDQAFALDPKNVGLILDKTSMYLEEGDLAGARLAIKEAGASVSPTVLVSYFANIRDLVWVLDDEQRDLLLRLTPKDFESEQIWAICLAQASWLNRDEASVRKYAEIAARDFARSLELDPQNAEMLAFLGLSLAYLGRTQEAVRAGERAVALRPLGKGLAEDRYCLHQLVRIYTILGEPEKALDHLELLMDGTYDLTPAWLKIDPNFDPLRSNPRFQKLVARAK